MTGSSYRRVLLRATLFAGLLVGLLPGARADDALPDTIAQLLDKHRIPASAVSFVVREMDGDASLLRFNAGVSRNPASIIKLLTTLAALELLGPGYQWQTAYLADGVIEDGVLRGDLILRGGGDPFITVEQMLGQALALRQRGLKTIAGELVIDNSRFSLEAHDRDAFDGRGERIYNVGPDAALVNFSASRFVIEPDGGQIRVRVEPPLAGLKIVTEIKAGAGKCAHPRAGWRYHIARADKNLTVRFSGVYQTKCGTYSFSRSILPNHEYTHRLFTALWRALGGQLGGGQLEGGYRIGKAPESARLLLTHHSQPLADSITGINKFSNNLMSRQLLLTVGAEVNGEPGSVASGIRALRDWLAANGIAMPALVMENGAGLSRKSRLSADGLWALLKHGWDSTYRPEFMSSLPLAAIDGTMRTRLRDSHLHGRARIKTGRIDGVRSMAGYVHARDNRHYGVVMIIDSRRVNFENGNAVQDGVLRWVYEGLR